MATCKCIESCRFNAASLVIPQHVFVSSGSCLAESCSREVLPPLNDDRQSNLHVMCQDSRSTVEQVRAFLLEYPQASEVLDVYGRPAIFYALKRGCAPDIVKLLFVSYPEGAVKQDFCGECGLYLLYHPSKHPSLLQALLRLRPSLSLHRTRSFSDKRLVDRICDPWSSNSNVLPSQNPDAWTKLVITVQAAHVAIFGDDSGATENALHAALELGLAPSLLCRFITTYPEQTSRPLARTHMLPLHYVLANLKMKASFSPEIVGPVIRELLAAHPAAARIPLADGKQLPLHVALANGCKWHEGVQELAFACHNALWTPDPVTGLCPVLLAAVAPSPPSAVGSHVRNSNNRKDLDTIFSLLKERPVVQTL